MKLKLLIALAAMMAMSAKAEIKREDYPSYKAYLEATSAYNNSYVPADEEKHEPQGAEIRYDRNEIWVSHDFESRALCEVYIDGELVGRQQRVPSWVPFIYKHDSSLRDVSSWEGHCEVVPHGRSGKAVDYSREAVNANYDREREEYLIRQGSTLSKKFEVHQQEMTQAEKAEAVRRAEKRYQESASSAKASKSHSLAGDDYKSELDALLNSFKK